MSERGDRERQDEAEDAGRPTTVRVTTVDLVTGQSDSMDISDDYVIVCAGSCYLAQTQAYPGTGTHVLTVKGRRSPSSASPAQLGAAPSSKAKQ